MTTMQAAANLVRDLADALLSAGAAASGAGNATYTLALDAPPFVIRAAQAASASSFDSSFALLGPPNSSINFSLPDISGMLGAAGIPATSPVRVSMLAMAFDPNSAPAAAAAAGRGTVVRLVLSAPVAAPASGRRSLSASSSQSASFAEVSVQNLRTPVYFSLPAPTTMPAGSALNPGLQATCSFYDPASSGYATAGCVSQPSPLPPGMTSVWAPNFTAANAAQLARAWNFTQDAWAPDGALAGCTEAFLDCSNASQVNLTIYPDPFRPLSVPAITCGGLPPAGVPARVLRVYYGHSCGVWQNASCAWNATAQVCAFAQPATATTAQPAAAVFAPDEERNNSAQSAQSAH